MRKVNFIALDPSLTCTGYCVNSFAGCKYTGAVKKRKCHKDRYSLFADLFAELDVLCRSKKIELAIIERYAFAAKGNAMTKLAEVGGVVRVVLALNSVKIYEMSSQTWKLITLGDARIKKQDIAEAAWQIYRIRTNTQDELDAWLMGTVVELALCPQAPRVLAKPSMQSSMLRVRKGLEEALGEKIK